MSTKQSKLDYITKYQKENYTIISLKLRTKEDCELISHLRSQPNISAYIRELVKRDAGK